MTVWTYGLATIAGQHHAVLYLVLAGLHHAEELINGGCLLARHILVARQAVPQPSSVLLGEFSVGGEDREIVYRRTTYEVLLPLTQFLAPPTRYATVIDTQRGVGDDQIGVDVDKIAKALAGGAGAHGRIEGEEFGRGLLKLHAVGLQS